MSREVVRLFTPGNTLPPALAVDRITKQFGGLTAVNQVSFSVQKGEIFGLIGPNGAGKTTLFNMVTGLLTPDRGTIHYQGEAVSGLPPHHIARRGIARTFQNIRLFGNCSVLENLTIAQHLHTRSNLVQSLLNLPISQQEERRIYQQAMTLLNLVGLTTPHSIANSLPYGDQRRLEIARALALKPQLLLLDEPAAGMNPSEKQQLSQFILQIRDQFDLTILLIEHHVPLVMGLCDRIAVLDFGQLIALGNPATVKADPAVIEAYLGTEQSG
jgi:branched-chain amino acid transport system ATP-binding protein